jgi:lipoprotein-anchoring transpeptidase ErfK/SrfK
MDMGRVAVVERGVLAHSEKRTRGWSGRVQFFAVIALLVSIVAPAATIGQSSAAEWSAPRTVYIPETGHTIDGVFLDVWRAWGGASAFGYPVTAELTENGRIVQYYHYARFEYVPDDPNGNVVHFGAIGQELKPVTVFRTVSGPVGGETDSNVAAQLAREARAWVPLSASEAEKTNTDTWRFVPETGHSVQMGFKDFWEQTGEASFLGNPVTEEYRIGNAVYQVFERGQLSWTAETGVTMMPVGLNLAKRYQIPTNPLPQADVPTYSEELFIPPPTPTPAPSVNVNPVAATGEKWIEINLSSQYLIAWQGSTPVAESYVSTGRPGFDTPPGTYSILYKLESEHMEGVLGGEYYNVPDVPWVMYFTSVGHAIHGAYWHSNFGAVMSHGCVNLPLDFAAWLYGWSHAGMRVEIHY